MTKMMALKATNVCKYYDEVKAVENLSLDILEHSTVALIGPNGAGKSTFINVITGLIPPTSGAVEIFGEKPKKILRPEDHKIGVLLQATRLFSRAKVRDYFEFYSEIYKTGFKHIEKIIDWMELGESLDKKISELSGGWRQRVALGLTLVNDPKMIVLDEPTVGLDPIARRGLWVLIENIKKEGKTIMVTTHYMEEAVSISDRLILIDNGSIKYDGAPKEIKEMGDKLEGGLDEAFEYYVNGERL